MLLSLSRLRYGVAGAASMAYLLLRQRLVRRPAKFPVDVRACLIILYLALFGSLAGYASYMFLLQNVRLSTAATYAYINPVVAILLGWWLLQETPHGTEWVGMVIVLVSVAAVIASRPPAGKAVAELGGPFKKSAAWINLPKQDCSPGRCCRFRGQSQITSCPKKHSQELSEGNAVMRSLADA
jgi:uncharacterized membrane protein